MHWHGHWRISGMKNSVILIARAFTFTLVIALNCRAGFAQSSVLSVNLAAFSGQVQPGGTVLLNWQTMMESYNRYFIIQRSGDGVLYQDLGKVKTQQTDSSHEFALVYKYVDPAPLPGISYYRLALVDKTGASSFTKIVEVNNNSMQGIRIYPTLVESNNLFVETDKDIRNARMELFDLSGNKITETNWQVLNGRQNFSFGASGGRLARGAYVVRLTSNGTNLLSQMIIVQSR
jgi:hypothetical protein